MCIYGSDDSSSTQEWAQEWVVAQMIHLLHKNAYLCTRWMICSSIPQPHSMYDAHPTIDAISKQSHIQYDASYVNKSLHIQSIHIWSIVLNVWLLVDCIQYTLCTHTIHNIHPLLFSIDTHIHIVIAYIHIYTYIHSFIRVPCVRIRGVRDLVSLSYA